MHKQNYEDLVQQKWKIKELSLKLEHKQVMEELSN